jgi:hypothetical protein
VVNDHNSYAQKLWALSSFRTETHCPRDTKSKGPIVHVKTFGTTWSGRISRAPFLLRRVVTEGLFTKLVRSLLRISFVLALLRWATARSEDCSSSLNYMYEGISCLGPTVLYLLNCTCTYTGGRRLVKRCEIAWHEEKPRERE